MREVGLYALMFGVDKTVKKFGYDEESVKTWVIQAFDDPFVKAMRNVILETIRQVGIEKTSKIFKISITALQRFMEENKRITSTYLLDKWYPGENY